MKEKKKENLLSYVFTLKSINHNVLKILFSMLKGKYSLSLKLKRIKIKVEKIFGLTKIFLN